MISKPAVSDKRYVTDKIWKTIGGNGEVTVKRKMSRDSEKSGLGLIEYSGICLEGLRKGTETFVQDCVTARLRNRHLPNTCCSPGPLHQPAILQFIVSTEITLPARTCYVVIHRREKAEAL
jgi:hypothetical protein